MTTAIDNVFETSFGKFCPCDKATYKKLKRIRFLLEKEKKTNGRFKWFWRKAPQNRCIRDKKAGTVTPVSEPVLFEPFYTKVALPENSWFAWLRKDYADQPKRLASLPVPEQNKFKIEETQLLQDFLADRVNARFPQEKAEYVKPLKLTIEQIDSLLNALEARHK